MPATAEATGVRQMVAPNAIVEWPQMRFGDARGRFFRIPGQHKVFYAMQAPSNHWLYGYIVRPDGRVSTSRLEHFGGEDIVETLCRRSLKIIEPIEFVDD